MNGPADSTGASIYYDGDCPFCSRYVQLLRLQDSLGQVRVVNLRQSPGDVARLRQAGFEPDEGMAFEFEDGLYFGQDAVHRLALLGTRSGTFNRVNRWLLGSTRRAALAYPVLRMGRNAALFLLGRIRLQEPSVGARAPWLLFHHALGLFALLHALTNSFRYNPPGYPSTWLMGALGIGLLLRPASTRLAAMLLLTFMVDAWAQLPVHSNHTMMKNVLLLAMAACAIRQMWRGGDWSAFFNDFAPTGRVLLLVMYVFGVFHKINTGFLDPEVSCAVALWREMPAFMRWIDFTAFHHAAIYGTLVIETLILVCLVLPRTRTVAIGLGIAFHSLLALSGYAMYVVFSTLSIALHVLFIERESAARILASPPWRAMRARLDMPSGRAALLAWAALVTVLVWNGSYSEVALAWMPVPAFLAWVIFRYGRTTHAPTPAPRLLWSGCLAANLLSLLFLVNGFAPYLGLKTAQSLNMFANLRLEAGASNHLIFRNPPGPFPYLADTVEIVGSSGSPYFHYIQSHGLQVTWYDLLDTLERTPRGRVSFVRNGVLHRDMDVAALRGEMERVLHPRWVRAFVHFNPVDLREPKPCALDR